MPPIESRTARDVITILLERIHQQNAIPAHLGSGSTDSDTDAGRLERIDIGARANRAVEDISVATSLEPVEKEVLLFWLIAHCSAQLSAVLMSTELASRERLISIVAGALLRPFALVAHAMREDGPLCAASLLAWANIQGEGLLPVSISTALLACMTPRQETGAHPE